MCLMLIKKKKLSMDLIFENWGSFDEAVEKIKEGYDLKLNEDLLYSVEQRLDDAVFRRELN